MNRNPSDMLQSEHDYDSGTKKSLLYGTDTGSNVLPILLDSDGQIKIEQVDKLNIGTDSTNYAEINSTGDIEPHGSATYKANGGNAGITQSETGVTDFDIVIEDGLITSFTKN